jgi:hypothetical protein
MVRQVFGGIAGGYRHGLVLQETNLCYTIDPSTQHRRVLQAVSMARDKKLGPPMSIRLDPDLKAILQQLADADERSLNSYINRALWRHAETSKKRPKPKS